MVGGGVCARAHVCVCVCVCVCARARACVCVRLSSFSVQLSDAIAFCLVLLDEFITSVTRANEESERLTQVVCEFSYTTVDWRLRAVPNEEAERVLQICVELRVSGVGCRV